MPRKILCLGLQVEQCKQENTKNNCSNITSKRTPYKITKNTPNAHKISSKASLLLSTRCGCKYCSKITKKKIGESKKGLGEIWAAWSCTENRCQKEERSLYFKGEKKEIPPLHALQVALMQEGGSLKGGGHHERRELSLEEKTQKWGKKPPILSLNLSLMPQGVTQGVEWAPHVVPITKWPIQWRW
jgi:hypothetical protein